jgi:hypothetical protein
MVCWAAASLKVPAQSNVFGNTHSCDYLSTSTASPAGRVYRRERMDLAWHGMKQVSPDLWGRDGERRERRVSAKSLSKVVPFCAYEKIGCWLQGYEKIWRPRRDLNPCYRRESTMADGKLLKLRDTDGYLKRFQ